MADNYRVTLNGNKNKLIKPKKESKCAVSEPSSKFLHLVSIFESEESDTKPKSEFLEIAAYGTAKQLWPIVPAN